MSISWGQSEDQWTAQARSAMDDAFADAALLGVSVTAAAGDDGSTDRQTSGVHADFPASSPHVLGCGGTSLELDASGNVASEVVWNGGAGGGATGGGISDAFPVPDYQDQSGLPGRSGTGAAGRGVPDIAAVADPATGYQVRHRRPVHRDRRHQRGRAAVGRAHLPAGPAGRQDVRPVAPDALRRCHRRCHRAGLS